MNTELPEDSQRQRLREHLESMITRTEKATSWHDAANSLRGLVNREGYVPIRTRLAVEDLDFLEGAREELLGFAALGVRLLDLHQPRDAGGITSDTAHPILRCRSCMWRWPCPTFRAMAEAFVTPRAPTSCQHVEAGHGNGEEAEVTLAVPAQPGVRPEVQPGAQAGVQASVQAAGQAGAQAAVRSGAQTGTAPPAARGISTGTRPQDETPVPAASRETAANPRAEGGGRGRDPRDLLDPRDPEDPRDPNDPRDLRDPNGPRDPRLAIRTTRDS